MDAYIVWEEQSSQFVGLHYAGGGNFDAISRPRTLEHRALWKADASDQDIENARQFIKSDKPEARLLLTDEPFETAAKDRYLDGDKELAQ